jgi:hypothetical protein
MATYSIESGSLHVKVEAENEPKAKELSNKIFDFLRNECKSQSEDFHQFSVVIFNSRGLFTDEPVPLPSAWEYLERT